MAKCTIQPKKEGKFGGVELKKDMIVVIDTDYREPLKSAQSSIVRAYHSEYGIDVSKILKPVHFEVKLSK